MVQTKQPRKERWVKMERARDTYLEVFDELLEVVKMAPDTKEPLTRIVLCEAHALFMWLHEKLGLSFEEVASAYEHLWDTKETPEFLHTMSYPDYLQTEHWQQKREEAHERANGRCQVCNTTSSLNVHHRTYIRRGYELPEDLIVLCKGCHQLFHDNGKLERES